MDGRYTRMIPVLFYLILSYPIVFFGIPRWDFDYVFFTESDQILISRELPLMYEHLKKYPGCAPLPKTLMALLLNEMTHSLTDLGT